ncbi:unnamed protein product [Phytomonas sp. EM1]|nr:unnamed protein product [Phytomonas sp. EM1]|eukprot:CCW61738.1 unnamed protein product [Phytomonas sp. isolate EM1]
MAVNRDRYTFQLAELKSTKSSALAFAEIAANFIRSYKDNKFYDVITSTIITTLLKSPNAVNEEVLKNMEAALVEQQGILIQKEREKEKRPKKWVAEVYNSKIDEDSDEEVDEIDPDEMEQRRIAEEEAEKEAESEWELVRERTEAFLEQRKANEMLLAQKARQVDTKAFEDHLKNYGAVLLNPGELNTKKGGKQGGKATSQISEEEVGKLYRDVAEVSKEKDRLKLVLSISDEEIPDKCKEVKQDLARLMEEAKEKGPFVNVKAKTSLSKAQISQLQQKLSKQMIEKNRLALQLKAMEVNEARAELMRVLTERDSIIVSMELAEAS